LENVATGFDQNEIQVASLAQEPLLISTNQCILCFLPMLFLFAFVGLFSFLQATIHFFSVTATFQSASVEHRERGVNPCLALKFTSQKKVLQSNEQQQE
jgi:hypothetical protein